MFFRIAGITGRPSAGVPLTPGASLWSTSDKPPWDSRPTVDNIWAAFTAAEWVTQQRLNWSHRERVFEMLKKKDAEIKQRRAANEG
jgi:hypothetical protein